MKKIILVSLIVILVCGAWAVRMHFNIEKTKIKMREVLISEQEMNRIGNLLKDRILDINGLVNQLEDSRLLLIGEQHLQYEIITYFLGILDRLPDEKLVLCLELPVSIQDIINNYLISGDESLLDSLKSIKGCLPYQEILKWGYSNPKRIQKVLAVDETQKQIRFRRKYLCTDTRNRTMKRRIYKAYHDYPRAKIIAYGGQMHWLKSGRYKFDIKNRVPAGSRLLHSGIPKGDIRVVMLSGDGQFSLASAWDGKIGAIKTEGELARIPFLYFYSYPVYRVSFAEDLFDYYVNVGVTTEMKR